MTRHFGLARAGIVAALSTLFLPLAAAPAGAQVPAAGADFGGWTTGTVAHATGMQGSGTRLANSDVAFSGASAESQGLSTAVTNEVERVVQPALDGKRSYGQGYAVGAGLAQGPSDPGQVELMAPAEQSAPENGPTVSEELAVVPASPVAYAAAARGRANARWAPDGCVVGADLSNGLGFVADAQVLDTAADDGTETLDAPILALDRQGPERAVSQSFSRVRLVPRTTRAGVIEGPGLGVMSETRMTIAPARLFAGTPAEMQLEFAGEWVLRAVATGTSGYVHYGPGEVTPSTPVVTIVPAGAEPILVTLQDILGEQGLVIDQIPGIEIAIGEDPRAIAGNAASAPTETATMAAGAVDVVRVRVTDPGEAGVTVADVRIGHMEAVAHAPEGGILCPGIDVDKRADRPAVAAGEEFTYTISVTNVTSDCRLERVRVVDTITTTEGVTYDIVGGDPAPDSVAGNVLTWNDVGPLLPGQTRQLAVKVKVADTSAAGRFTNNAVASAVCGLDSAQDQVRVNLNVTDQVTINVPGVDTSRGPTLLIAQRTSLPRTGGEQGATTVATGGALLLVALVLRKTSRLAR